MKLQRARAWGLALWLSAGPLVVHGQDSPAGTAPPPPPPASDPDPTVEDTSRREMPQMVAGRTQSEWSDALAAGDELVRLQAVRSIQNFGPVARPPLTKALSDPSAAVRYWAAYGLGDLARGRDPQGRDYPPAHAPLRKMLKSPSAGEQISAAYALCRFGQVDEGLPVLIAALDHDERSVVCSAADFIGRIGPAALPAESVLETVATSEDNHRRGAAKEALRRIRRKPKS